MRTETQPVLYQDVDRRMHTYPNQYQKDILSIVHCLVFQYNIQLNFKEKVELK